MAKAANTSNKQIETLADLTPDPRNARKHNPRNVGMLEKSLNEVGAARSIVIDENGVVLAGNATIEAAGRAGIERVQVIDADGETIVAVRRTGLTQTQKTRLALYDNRTAELADWDADLMADLMANERAMLDGLFENNELLELIENIEQTGSVDAEPQIDRAAELNEKWQVKPQDLWRIGNHRLLCGDCTVREDVQRVMGGEQADMCFTSPPYNGNTHMDYGKGVNKKLYNDDRDNLPLNDWLELTYNALSNTFSVIKDGFIFWNISYNSNNRSGYVKTIIPFIENLWETIVWKKTGMPIPSGFTRNYEFIFVFGVGNHGHVNKTFDNKSNFWQVSNLGSQDKETHRAAFPLELAKMAIEYGKNIIYEPFAGSGTTLVASENLRRKCLGIEISPNYCAVILERMQTAFPALVIERIT